MLIEDLVIVENKTVVEILPIHIAQLLTYLILKDCKVGFLLNWNVRLMKNGIMRIANGVDEPVYPVRINAIGNRYQVREKDQKES